MASKADRGRELRERTKRWALRVIRLYCALPKTSVAQVLSKQLLRGGTSVGAHYREACRARSPKEFISKIEVALQELDEASYWLELLADTNVVKAARLADLQNEANELTSILVSSVRTTKKSMKIAGAKAQQQSGACTKSR